MMPQGGEVVVAGAASTLGKIGTIPVAGTLYVRAPCNTEARVRRLDWRVRCDKAHAIQFYRTNSVVNSVTLDISANTMANTETIIVNALTFTAHTNTTTVASRQFAIDGTATVDAEQLAICINNATYGVPGVTAVAAAGIVTLTATTATVIQAVTGTAGGKCVVTNSTLISLIAHGAAYTGVAANSTTAGTFYEQWIDGWPHAYLGISNSDGAAAATVVVGATRY